MIPTLPKSRYAVVAGDAADVEAGFMARGKIEHAGLPHFVYRLSLA